jgi:xanthine dehydrogenase accessory factor
MLGKSLNESACELLRTGRSFVLAVIVEQDGSTPRESGAKMLILPESIAGTIGGGPTEGAVMSLAREDLRAEKSFRFVSFDMSGKDQSDAEPICGGSTEVLIARIDASDETTLAVFEAAVKAEREGIPAWMYYIADENEGAACPFQLAVNLGGEIIGKLYGNEKRLRYLMSSPLHAAMHGEKADGVRYIADEVGLTSVMYLFGCGHVSVEVARLAVGLGFRTVVFDDRAEYANEQRFRAVR